MKFLIQKSLANKLKIESALQNCVVLIHVLNVIQIHIYFIQNLLYKEALESRDYLCNVLLQNVVFDNVEHKLDILCVSGTCEVGVDISRSFVVNVDEEFRNVFSSSYVITFRTCVCVCVYMYMQCVFGEMKCTILQ